MNTKSIRFRLTVWYSTALIISIAVIFVSFYIITQQELYQHTDVILTSHAKQVASYVQKQLENGGIFVADSLPYNEFGVIPGMLLFITDKDGAILYSTYPYKSIQNDISYLFNQSKQANQETILNRDFLGTSQRMILISLYKDNKLLGTLMMGHPIDVIQKSLNSLLTNLISLFALIVIPTIFGGWILAKRAMQPIDSISEQMQRITSKNLKERINNPQTHDEIETLVHTFNNLLVRLETAFSRERQFIGDVAHELKTPLATQRTMIEVMLSKQRSNEEHIKTLNELLVDNQHLTNIVKDVLELAWSEADKTQLNTETTNLSDLTEELYEIAIKLSETKKLTITKHITKNLLVAGKRDKLLRALLNIVDNAIKYTPNGTIVLSLTNDINTVIVKVKDTGEGISNVDIPHIFKRFYRGRKSQLIDGSGLGLAIAYSIITTYKGKLTVKNNHGKGVTITAFFPLIH